MAGADTIERLQRYLRELSPQARLLLISELERAVLRGDRVDGGELILQELRRIVREQRNGAPRITNAARLFFKPFEPFLVDDSSDRVHPGRIARSSIEPLWNWLSRDLLPKDANVLTEEVDAAVLAGDKRRAEDLARAFQDRVNEAIGATFDNAAADEKVRRTMLAQIGTQRASDDAATLRGLLKGRDALNRLGKSLPAQIPDLVGNRIDKCMSLIESAAARDRELFLHSLLAVMSRLSAPWQVIRFGVKAAGSDTAARVAETQYSVGVTVVLAELDRLVRELRTELQSGLNMGAGALLKSIHDSARGLRTELHLPVDSTWGRALAAQRAQISDLLKAEIESMPGRVRRLLRPRPSAEIRQNSVLDASDVAETEALVEFVGGCRNFAGELALSEMTQRTYSELQQYLDSGTRTLLDGLRHAGPADRKFRQSQVAAAVRFCATVFGQEYASLLGKAAEVAATPERKAAQA